MIEFEVRTREMKMGKYKGKTMYYAAQKNRQNITREMVVERIVRETSLSAGDVQNAIISLTAVLRDAMLMGASVDLADLGTFRVSVASKFVEKEEDVSAAILKKPKVVFSPRMKTRDAVARVRLSVAGAKGRTQAGGTEDTGDTGDTGNESTLP